MTTKKKSIRKYILNLSFFLTWFILMSLWDNRHNTYTGFYYPDTTKTTDNPIIQWWFKNKSNCFDWINTQIKWNNKEDFECWINCKYMTNFWVYKCDKTFDSL